MKRVMLLVILASAVFSSQGCNATNRQCNCGGPIGCRPCKMGWQRGGTDYQRFLSGHRGDNCNGNCGQTCGVAGGHGGQYANAQPAGAGEASGGPMAQVAYPYYTTRGPRDFFLDNPPTIGR